MHARNSETKSDLSASARCGDFVLYHDSSEIHAEVIEALMPDPDRLFASGQVIQSPWQSAATDKTVVRIGARSYFFKRYNCLGDGYRLKNLLRNSKALKSWRAGWKFLEQGLPTPRPVACLEERRFRLLGRSYLLFELLEDSGSLLDLWGELSDEHRIRLLSLMGAKFGEMHRRGILHGDLNWRNILVRRADRDYEFYLVDLDGSRSRKKLRREEAVRDLSHFMRDVARNKVSAEEQQCFLDRWQRMFG